MTMLSVSMPALRGSSLALLAATLFGISTPLVQRSGVGLGAFTTAALLYGGAAVIGALLRQPVEREAALRRTDLGRLACMALFGAAIGPVALAWGVLMPNSVAASSANPLPRKAGMETDNIVSAALSCRIIAAVRPQFLQIHTAGQSLKDS